MIDGHGDDLYRYGDQIRMNFSSNVYSGAEITYAMLLAGAGLFIVLALLEALKTGNVA